MSATTPTAETAPIDVDVLVAGGGLVGLTLAVALGRAGLSVAVVDRLAPDQPLETNFDGRASALSFAVWRMLGALGIAQHIAQAEPILDILVTDADRRRQPSPLSLQFDRDDAGEEALGWMVENRHIRVALDAAAATCPNLHRLAPDAMDGFEVDGPHVTARLASGRAVRARLLVGADGRQSQVREALKIRSYGWPYRQSALVTTVHLGAGHGGTAYEMFLPDGPLAVLPLSEDRANIVWSQHARLAQARAGLAPDALGHDLTQATGGAFGAMSLVAPAHVWPLELRLAAEWVRPRVTLAGDAAHVIHPLAGQGLNLGLKDVAALAEVLVAAARVGEDIGSTLVLDRYAAWRRADTVTLALACEGFTRLFSNEVGPLRMLRTAGLGLVDTIAPARRFFARHAGGAAGDLPRLLRGEALA